MLFNEEWGVGGRKGGSSPAIRRFVVVVVFGKKGKGRREYKGGRV